MAFTELFSRTISHAQSKYEIKQKNVTQQSSYNLSLDLMDLLLSANVIVQTEENHYEVVDDYVVKLGNGILKLIGKYYDQQELNVKFIYTKSNDGTRKFQIKRKENNTGKYEWFLQLYDKNYEDSEFKVYLNENDKILLFDTIPPYDINDCDYDLVDKNEIYTKIDLVRILDEYCQNIGPKECALELFGFDYATIMDKNRVNINDVANDLNLSTDDINSFNIGKRLGNVVQNRISRNDTKIHLGNISRNNTEEHSTSKNAKGYNKIYYGIPGCGKSYYIENTVLKDVDKDNDVFRTTFYLDYSNSDFIGQIYPVVKDGNVTYEPKPGHFTKALERALRNPGRMIYLVIEEINRGNAAAIFGDTFQLLDRLKENRDDRVVGDSEYPVANEFIEGYFEKVNEELKEDEKIKFTKNKIFIPHNLTLLATMNTSDQNVFPLDTAFKRRWDREKVMTDWNKVGDIKNLYVPFTDITWGKFATTINDKMLKDNGESDVSVSEDKQMGAYFVKENMLSKEKNAGDKDSLRAFISNVMDYLYNDVTKFNHELLFDKNVKTYDGLYETMTECTSVLNGNVDDSSVGVGKRLFESVLNKEIVDELFDQDVEDEQGTQD